MRLSRSLPLNFFLFLEAHINSNDLARLNGSCCMLIASLDCGPFGRKSDKLKYISEQDTTGCTDCCTAIH